MILLPLLLMHECRDWPSIRRIDFSQDNSHSVFCACSWKTSTYSNIARDQQTYWWTPCALLPLCLFVVSMKWYCITASTLERRTMMTLTPFNLFCLLVVFPARNCLLTKPRLRSKLISKLICYSLRPCFCCCCRPFSCLHQRPTITDRPLVHKYLTPKHFRTCIVLNLHYKQFFRNIQSNAWKLFDS